jgi:hypothetical protein
MSGGQHEFVPITRGHSTQLLSRHLYSIAHEAWTSVANASPFPIDTAQFRKYEGIPTQSGVPTIHWTALASR